MPVTNLIDEPDSPMTELEREHAIGFVVGCEGEMGWQNVARAAALCSTLRPRFGTSCGDAVCILSN
jgi:hypothetical protein